MEFIKCPKCKSTMADIVKKCPVCGLSTEYFQEESDTSKEKFIPQKEINKDFKLYWGYCADRRALDVYKRFVIKFKWDPSKTGFFAPLQFLYAKKATPEGYDVYMMVHNNLCEAYNERFSWFTYMKGETIEEVWFIDCNGYREDLTGRVVFARTPRGYEFQGIYKFYRGEIRKINGKDRVVKIYKRISQIYPTDKINDFEPLDIRAPKLTVGTSIVDDAVDNIDIVVNKCKIKVYIEEENKESTVVVDTELRPWNKELLGKKIGDTFLLPGVSLTYRIKKILLDK